MRWASTKALMSETRESKHVLKTSRKGGERSVVCLVSSTAALSQSRNAQLPHMLEQPSNGDKLPGRRDSDFPLPSTPPAMSIFPIFPIGNQSSSGLSVDRPHLSVCRVITGTFHKVHASEHGSIVDGMTHTASLTSLRLTEQSSAPARTQP